MTKLKYVDLHCHPALKPLGKSFKRKYNNYENNPNSKKKNSIYYYDKPSEVDKWINVNPIVGLTKFSQSNFTALAKGGVAVICASLYPLEKGFVNNLTNTDLMPDTPLLDRSLLNLAVGIGNKRIKFIDKMEDYFADLVGEYDFYKQLDNQIIQTEQGDFRYKLVNSFDEIEKVQQENAADNIPTLCVVLSIEGMNVLNTGIPGRLTNETEVLDNLKTIKEWEFRPFFVTLAHHFNNDLCGHAKSFPLPKFILDQTYKMGTGFTPLGETVVKRLLDNSNNDRILIDLKHMSLLSRQHFYKMIEDNEIPNIPIIISHGAMNGKAKLVDLIAELDNNGSNTSVARYLKKDKINFCDDEIIRLAKSGGIIGLQLDERRVANKKTIKKVKKRDETGRAKLFWNQIQHIVEVLDSEDLGDEKILAWDCISIGSDYDGIIDPLNEFWTAEDFPSLEKQLLIHAKEFKKNYDFKQSKNGIDADKMIKKIMYQNALDFMKKHFNPISVTEDDLIADQPN